MNKATTVRRLTIFRDYLIDVVAPLVKRKPHKWDMSLYATDIRPDLNCQTAACAMGWACMIPAFRRKGLYLKKSGDYYFPVLKDGRSTEEFFGITIEEEWEFTLQSNYNKDNSKITVKDVAKQITKLIKKYNDS